MTEFDTRPTMDEPARYRIRVRGNLDARWTKRIGGLRISEIRTPDGDVQTALTGRLEDQAALANVLNTLYELNLPLISVVWQDL